MFISICWTQFARFYDLKKPYPVISGRNIETLRTWKYLFDYSSQIQYDKIMLCLLFFKVNKC